MTHGIIVALALLGLIGQVVAGLLIVCGLLWLARLPAPLAFVRSLIWGYELWLAFLVSAVATAGSLFFSEIAHFEPCRLCWFQRISMYPLSITTLLAALFNDHRAARYLLPLPLVGAGISSYQLLVENGVVSQTQACLVSAPAGCTTRWIAGFGYVTIPTLALTGFLLAFAWLLFAAAGSSNLEPSGAPEPDDDEPSEIENHPWQREAA